MASEETPNTEKTRSKEKFEQLKTNKQKNHLAELMDIQNKTQVPKGAATSKSTQSRGRYGKKLFGVKISQGKVEGKTV